MERRNRSLKALQELQFIDTLDDNLRAQRLQVWYTKYLDTQGIESFDLPLEELKALQELFYKNILFLKKYNSEIQDYLHDHKKIEQFFK